MRRPGFREEGPSAKWIDGQGELAAMTSPFQAGQFASWSGAERAMPNELVNCAVFSVRNRKEKREHYTATTPLVVPIIGGGEVVYIGEELRQDDETVWMQLIHMAKEARSETVTFTPYSFIQAIRWPDKGTSYTRLLATLRRLKATSLEVYSDRFDKGVSISLIQDFTIAGGERKPWSVNVFNSDLELLLLFDKPYSRLDWETRLALPEGVATWLHGFFSSHRAQFDQKVATLVIGAGLKLDSREDEQLEPAARETKRKERRREAKKTIKQALEALVNVGFLENFSFIRNDVVHVVRSAAGWERSSGLTPPQPMTHDKWFRAEVDAAIKEADDPDTVWVSNEDAKREWGEKRAELVKLVEAREGRAFD
jgi:TrfA protein